MDRAELLKNVYEDFFGPNTIEIRPVTKTENVSQSEVSDEDRKKKVQESFQNIEQLNIDDNSKETLKKIITYTSTFKEGKQYISFNMCILTDNQETLSDIVTILRDNMNNFSYVQKGDISKISFYDIDKAETIEQIYSTRSNFIIFKDFQAFTSKDQNEKNRILHKLNENISSHQKIITVLYAKNKEELQEIFLMSDEIKNEFSDFEIVGKNPDIQDMYQEVLEKIEKDKELDEEFKIKILDYISATYPETSLPYPKYRDDLCEKILFNNEVPEYNKDKSIDEIFAELNNLVGLEKVKKMLKELVSLVELKNKTKDDLKLQNVNLHMVFLGNPGTGKTTVARIVAEILYNLKYIKQNKLLEVSSKDLVAEYVGQTAPKTMSVINKALGGVLFIDEAYSLASGSGQGNSYNEEAVATLIQAMENNRDNLVVIFAGYTKEMQDFLNLNSGIVSRIGYTVEFEDYTTDELVKIFMQMMNKAGFTVSKEAVAKVEETINEYKNTKNFGNARFARNLYEKTIVKHAANTDKTRDKRKLKTIQAEDISTDNLIKM